MGLAARDKIDTHNSSWKAITDASQALTAYFSAHPDELAEEHALLAGITTNIRSGFLLFNQAEHLAYANPSAQRLLGMNGGKPYPATTFDVRKELVELTVNPASAQIELDRVWRHPEEESSVDLALAEGAIRWLRVQSFPVFDAPGRLLGRGLLLDDITLERSATQTRNETLAMAAHELKTPLAIIKGSATTLLSNSMRWDQTMQREMLHMIDTQADRLHEILNTLLEVWRLDAGVQKLLFSQTRLPEMLTLLVERWQKNAPRHHFVCDFQENLPAVLCDPSLIEPALHQLLHNAVNFSPHGGSIRIVLQSQQDQVRLSISDEGNGIAPEYLEHIFDRFYRIANTDSQMQGAGLGLAVVRAAIEAHGGKVWADSPGPDQGTTFYCSLPFTPPGAQSTVPTWTASGTLPALHTQHVPSMNTRHGQRVRVAVVESDTRIARYLRANLEEQQYRVQVINQGTQFLRQFDLEEPDLVLLASHLHDMQGIELLQRLREFSHVPVMVLCDEDDEDERVHLLDLGADDLVSKPFNIKELMARLRVLLRRQGSSQESETSESIFTSGDLVIDYAQHQVLLQGCPIQLSRTEYKLLCTLAQNVGRVMTHELLLERVWGAEYNREVDFIWVYISRLRRKIEPDSRHPRYIVTVPDVGYKLVKC